MRRAWTPICIVANVLVVVWSGCALGRGSSHAARGADSASGSAPTTYYVDAARGRDSNSGTSPDAPWKTLSPLAGIVLRGGDAVLLRGGQWFKGTIRLGTGNLGATSRTSVLRIGSYGGGRATILAPFRQSAISATDVAGIRVSAINLAGRSPRCRKDVSNGYRDGAAGVRVEARLPHTALEQGISIDHVDVSGFCNGIVVGSAADDSRISHLRVTAVRAHDNASAGVWTYDQANRQHAIRDVRVSNSRAYRNGVRGGIVLFGVDGGRVERSVAFANGRAAGGGVGIWAFDSNRILFAHNESYGNGRRGIDDDGDGFDFDRGVSNSVMVHNYSHDNGGVGFLVCSCNGKYYPYYQMRNDTIRSNISRNDGSSGQPSLQVEGGELMTGIEIVSNRVESAAGDGPLVKITGCLTCDEGWRASYLADVKRGGAYTGVRLRGNSFVSGGTKPIRELLMGTATALVFRDNRWREG